MIASFAHNFIFIKTKKTASTSLEIALSLLCGPDDVISPIGAGVELERARAGGSPRNFTRDPDLERRYLAALEARDAKALRRASSENRATGGCTGHMSATAVRAWLPEDFWRSALKFTSERHPYEKALSMAYFQFRGEPEEFPAFLEQTVQDGAYAGFGLYAVDGASAMDEFILYDSLQADVDRVLGRLGLALSAPLPHSRGGHRADERPAAEVLSEAQKAEIRRRCDAEFALLGWPA